MRQVEMNKKVKKWSFDNMVEKSQNIKKEAKIESDESQREMCETCNGSGMVVETQKYNDGTGEYEAKLGKTECHVCEGSGKVRKTITSEEFLEEWDHFLDCIDFKHSYLDARAIRFMNSIEKNIKKLED